MIKRISITGPESSGKSTLAIDLALHFKTEYVPEISRSYLNKLDRAFNYEDIELIAKKQLEEENRLAAKANKFLFCDTDMLVNKVWCDVKFEKCTPWIENAVNEHRYDLYLLCKPDLRWEFDPLREDEHGRDQLFEIYKMELQTRKFPYEIISGEHRLEQAINFIKVWKDTIV